MKDLNLDALIDSICNAEYTYRSNNGETHTLKIVSRYSADKTAERAAISEAVYTWASSNIDTDLRQEIGILEAKCYAYEQIIANSNFAPVIKEVSNEEQQCTNLQ